MKTKLLISAFLFIISNIFSQAPNYLWSKSAGGSANDKIRSVSTDANGNVFIAGYFNSLSITFGTTTLTNTDTDTTETPLTYDIFIVKYDATGNVLWAKSEGGTSHEEVNSISTDANGNAYITGFFTGSFTIGTTTLTSVGSGDAFIVKYDPSGNMLWAKSAGESWGSGKGMSVSTDSSGNVFMSGSFTGSGITFGATYLTNTSSSSDIFIVKYDAFGNVLWAKSAGGTFMEESYSVSTDANGNVFMTGSFQSPTITFGATTLTNADSTGSTSDIFIVKYDASGTILWAKSAGGTPDDWGTSISTDQNGNVFMTGHFRSPTITFETTTLNSVGSIGDIFIVKYDASGNVLWAKSEGGTSFSYGNSVSTDPNGNVFIAGYFQSPTITFGTTILTNADSTGWGLDIFIVKYDISGNVLWAKSVGGTDYDLGSCVSTDVNGNVFLTGYFLSSSITFGTTTYTNAGDSDMFIAKIDATTGIEENYSENVVSVFPNPFSTQTTLNTGNNLHNATLTIFNCFGQIVKQINNISGKSIVLNRDNLASGLYFISLIEYNKIIATDKLVIANK